MNFKNKNGFITVYVLISMIFLITIITIALINVSSKLKSQTQINSEIQAMYEKNDIDNLIINYTKEIPIYTKEQFIYLKNWINNATKTKEYMNINGYLYELDPNEKYIFDLKTDLYIENISEIENLSIEKNEFNYYLETTEIPIYTKEQFENLKKWIINTERKRDSININNYLYELNPYNYNKYVFYLKADIYISGNLEIKGLKINENEFVIHDEILEELKRIYEGTDALPGGSDTVALDINSYNVEKGCYSLLPINGETVEGNEVYILMSGKSAIINVKGNKYVVTVKNNKLNKIQNIPESNILELNGGRDKILMNLEDFLTEDNELLLFDIDYDTLYKNSTIKTYQKLAIGENVNYGHIMLNEKLNNLTLDFNEINVYSILIPINYKGTIIANKVRYTFSGYQNNSYEVIELDGKKYYSIQNK